MQLVQERVYLRIILPKGKKVFHHHSKKEWPDMHSNWIQELRPENSYVQPQTGSGKYNWEQCVDLETSRPSSSDVFPALRLYSKPIQKGPPTAYQVFNAKDYGGHHSNY